MFGLGKPRSPLGKWLDKKGVSQQWLVKKTKLNKATISRLASDNSHLPSGSTIQKIIKALKEIDPSVSADKFWDI